MTASDKKAIIIKKLVDEHFEPGRQDRSMVHIFRTVVSRQYPMSERTFWRLIKTARKYEEKQNNGSN